MRIGMVLDKEFPQDARVEKEATSLVAKGYDVSILSFNYGKRKKYENYKGIKIYRYKFIKQIRKKGVALVNTIFDFYTTIVKFLIINFIKNHNIDVLHVHDLHLLGAALSARNKIEFILIGDLHENYAHAIKNYAFSKKFHLKYIIPYKKWKKKEKEWIKKTDAIISVVDEMKERLSKFYNKKQIFVVPNYIDFSLTFEKYKKDKNISVDFNKQFIVSYIGSIDRHKGLDILIGSLEYLKELSDLKILIIGNGRNLKDLKKYAKKNYLQDKVIFKGWLNHNILPNYYSITDIFCIPHIKNIQTDNSSPGKLFRYMASGKPIIVSNCKSVARIINECNAGTIFESGNKKDLANKIYNLYKNPQKRNILGKNGILAVENKYNWEKAKTDLLKLYNKISRTIDNS